jgi:hypothetical protein
VGYFPAFFPFLAFRFSFRLFCASFLLALLPPLSLFAKVLLLSAIARSSG